MINATAREVTDHFAEFMDRVQIEPVIVDKNADPYAVLIGYDEYLQLRGAEDASWGEAAAASEASGYVGPDEVARLHGVK